MITIIVPVFNEEKTIRKIVRKLENLYIGIEKEIIIVDDASTDQTKSILSKISNPKIRKFFHSKNQGKGGAIKTALKHAAGDIISIQDADLEYNPSDIPKLIKPIIDKQADVVYGSRFMKKFGGEYILVHHIGNKILSLLTTILFGQKLTDMETCYKAFRRDVLDGIKVNSQRFDFEPEITAKIIKKGYKILEVPISFNPRSFKEGKKITWRDGLKAGFVLLKYRFLN